MQMQNTHKKNIKAKEKKLNKTKIERRSPSV